MEREKEEGDLLYWIEKSIGDYRQKSSAMFEVRPDTSIKMGKLKYERNFKEDKKQIKLLSKRPQSSKINMGVHSKFMKTDRIEDTQQLNLEDKHESSPLRSTRHQLADFPVLAERETSMDPLTTLNQPIEEQSQESDTYSKKIISGMKDITPKFLPLHIHPDRIQVVFDEYPEEMKATVEGFVKKVQTQTKGASLNSEELVLTYVDKQVRKQLMIAIEEGNCQLLQNYVKQFKESLKNRSDQLNFRTGTLQEGEDPIEDAKYPLASEKNSPVEGDTVLHYALMMNYETHKPFLDFEKIYQDIEDTLRLRSARPPPAEGTGSEPYDGEISEKKLTMKKVKKALSGESEASLAIKIQIVSILIKAGADSSIKNNSGISPNEIAKELKMKNLPRN
mmetsp:Transcript_13258/g.20738  ORF Transcript_13258/g.20738 Transcript_13258/m.20738 type:complete len:392 (-) Transcript_13258:35-1210(-)